MIINSTRVGTIEVQEQDLIHFPAGVVGLPDWQDAVIVPVPDLPLFAWLQFTHDPDAAFLLLDVQALYPDYNCDLARQQAGAHQTATVFTIVKVPNGDFSQTTTNLMGPIVIQPPASSDQRLETSDKPQETSDNRQATSDKRLGTQVIIHDSNYPMRHPLFAGETAC